MRAIVSTILVAAAFAAAPATAAPEACAAAPAALRSAAASATVDAQRVALTNVSVGEKLCDAGNRFEANRKFKVAAKALNLDLATVMAGTATAAAAE
jgi:hypothetical protein